MRISDWSSDVCSADLRGLPEAGMEQHRADGQDAADPDDRALVADIDDQGRRDERRSDAAQPLHQAEHAKHRTGADRGEQRMIERIALDAGLALTVRATVSNMTNQTFVGKPTPRTLPRPQLTSTPPERSPRPLPCGRKLSKQRNALYALRKGISQGKYDKP